jgi:hypothetical protein
MDADDENPVSYEAFSLYAASVGHPPGDIERVNKSLHDEQISLSLALADAEQRASAAEATLAETLKALRQIYDAFARMPDAGLAKGDPRYDWWNETHAARENARAVLRKATLDKLTRESQDVEGGYR